MKENNKERLGMVFGVLAIIIMIGGFIAFSSMQNGMSESAMTNCTTTMSAGDTMFGFVPIAISLFIIIGCLFLVNYIISTPNRFMIYNKTIKRIISFLSSSAVYFCYGLAGVTIIAVPAFLLYFALTYAVTEGDPSFFINAFKWIGILVACYFGIAGIGYLFKTKLINKYKLRKEEMARKNA